MKVLFDHQIFSTQKYGGISRYFANLHYGINELPGPESELGLLFTDNVYIKEQQLPARMLNKLIKKQKKRYKYNRLYSEYLLRRNDFDLFHPTYYDPYFLKFNKGPFVLTVHDMIHELYPQYYLTDLKTKDNKKRLIEQAAQIIAISENTKTDLQKFYNISDDKISVVYHGYKVQADSGSAEDTKVDGQYLLFVGDRPFYKNFELFIKAAAPLMIKYSLKVICAGGGIFRPEEIELLTKLNIISSVQQLNVTDQQLAGLYKHAAAFIYPSFYEGFGLPVLEAFFNNCPVIMSNTSALPEAGGDAAAYFNPMDEQSVAFAIDRVLNSAAIQDDLRKKGREQLTKFSFNNSLQKTLRVYNTIA